MVASVLQAASWLARLGKLAAKDSVAESQARRPNRLNQLSIEKARNSLDVSLESLLGLKKMAHGVDVGAAEAVTGLRSDARCASRHPHTLPRAITPEFSRARRADRELATRLDVLAHPAVRRELRKLYDAAIYVGSRTPVRRPAPRDCRYRMHVRRGDARYHKKRPVPCGDSMPSTRRRPRNWLTSAHR